MTWQKSVLISTTALNGSKHIEWLLSNKLIRRIPSEPLEQLYSTTRADDAAKPEPQMSDTKESINEPPSSIDGERMLLKHASGKVLGDVLDVPELAPEIERAVRQVESALKAKAELKDEKEELKAATETQQNKKV